MRSSLVSRRVLGLAAAGVLSLSTLALPGIASAEEGEGVTSTTSTETTTTAPADETTAPVATDEDLVLAAAPDQPYLNYADGFDGGLELDFHDSSSTSNPATSYEASTDGSTWVALTAIERDGVFVSGTLTGLTNGTTYSVRVRGVNSSGASGASNSVSGVPFLPISAPTGVQVNRSATGVTVTWGTPTTAGTFPLDGFSAGWSSNDDGAEGCAVDAAARSCTFSLPNGGDFAILVFAVDDHDGFGDPASVRSGPVPASSAPTAVPTKDDGDIVGPAGPISSLTAGKQIVLQGAGYLPGSTVRLTVFSSPVELGTATVASDGTFSATVTVPAGLTNGTHTLVATGYAPDGTARNLVITVTVSGGVATLAVTGFDAVPMAVGGGLVVLAGAGLVLGGRRRKA